jgi:hypothetical protein
MPTTTVPSSDLRLVPGGDLYDPKAAQADYAADPTRYVLLFGGPPSGPPPALSMLIPGRYVLAGLVGLGLLIFA